MKKLEKGMVIEGRTIDEVLYAFNMWYSGWECDSVAWIVRFTDGERGVVETNHGSFEITHASSLEQKIREYKGAIQQTEQALAVLDGI